MSLWGDSFHFFMRERRWGVLFISVLLIYGSIIYLHSKTVERPPSEAVEKFKIAEQKLKKEIHSQKDFQEFLAQKPGLLLIFNLFSLFLLGGILVGLVIDSVWVFQRRWRERLLVAHGPPQARNWSIETIAKIILLFMVATLALSLFLAFARTVFFPKASSNLLILVHTTFADFLCIGLVVYFIRRLGGRWQDLGFRGVRLWKDIGVGLIGYLAILPLFFSVLALLLIGAHLLGYEPPPHALVEVFLEEEKRAPLLIVYSIFLACVAGPVFEEIFFRGFCYPAFKKRWGVGWGLVLSSAFFGLIHQNIFAFFPIFILGLVLGYLYEKRGTLVPSIVLHIVHNTVFISYFFLAKEILEGSGG